MHGVVLKLGVGILVSLVYPQLVAQEEMETEIVEPLAEIEPERVETSTPEEPVEQEMPSVPEEPEIEQVQTATIEAAPAVIESPSVVEPEVAAEEMPAQVDVQKATEPVVQEIPEQQVPQVEQEAPVGIDTMDIAHDTKGNWLYKRFWWERARKLYDELAQQVGLVFEARNPFFTRRTELDRSVFDPFYSQSGYEKGELSVILDSLIKYLEQVRAKGGVLNEQERDLLAKGEKEKETLEQLRQDTEAIGKLDAAVDDALATLSQQINMCRSYEQQALQKLHEIARELSDKRAKELYHEMRVSFDNVLAIDNYIKGSFAAYFETLGAKAKEHVDRVTTTLASLKERGIDLSKQVEKIREQERAEKEGAACPAQEQVAESGQGGVWGWVSAGWNAVVGFVQKGFDWMRSWWSGTTEVPEQAATKSESQEAPTTAQQVEPLGVTETVQTHNQALPQEQAQVSTEQESEQLK